MFLALPSLCIHPVAQALVPLLVGAGLLHAVWLRVRPGLTCRTALLVYPVLVLLALWLGWYRLSPLGFSTGRVPLLRAFLIVRPQRAIASIKPGQVIAVRSGTAIGIQPVLLPGPARCFWSSSTGGAFDDPASCDTVYKSEEGARYDMVRIHVTSSCDIPPVSAEARLSILP